jgi:hypothetical protein
VEDSSGKAEAEDCSADGGVGLLSHESDGTTRAGGGK